MFGTVLCQKIEGPPHAAEHAQAQHIDLHKFEGIDIVLVPLDDLPLVHGSGFDRHQFVEAVLGQHEAARMLRKMSRHADEVMRQIEGEPQPAVGKIEVQLLGLGFAHPFRAPAPNQTGQSAGNVFAQPKRLADVSHRATRAIADDSRRERRPVTAIGVVNPLNDFLPPLMLKIHVDVRRLPSLLADEAFEEQIARGRVDRGDAQNEAHGRVCGAPAALAQDIFERAKRTIELTVRKYGA